MKPPFGEKRFLFYGHAVPLAGRIRRPQDVYIEAQAPTSAPATGGRAHALVNRPKLPGEVAELDFAESSVDADFDQPQEASRFTFGNHGENTLPVRTRTWCVVNELKLALSEDGNTRRVNAGRVELGLESRSRRDGTQCSIRPLVALIDRLDLDGYGLRVTFREKMFADHDTRDKLCEAYEKNDRFYAECGHMFFEPPKFEAAPEGRRRMPEVQGLTHGTLVEKLEWTGTPHPDVQIEGNALYLPGFGHIYFGEFMMTANSRRVIMMRIHFGSPIGGELTVADSGVNGVGWPPGSSGL